MRLRHDRGVAGGGVTRDRQHYHLSHYHHLPSLQSSITIITQSQLHATVVADTTTIITT